MIISHIAGIIGLCSLKVLGGSYKDKAAGMTDKYDHGKPRTLFKLYQCVYEHSGPFAVI